MLATDPLSLVFLGCIVFSGAFLIISMLSGVGHGHMLHVGHATGAGHVAHVGHVGHAGHVGHTGHLGHAGTTHAADAGHAGHASGHAGAAGSSATTSPLATLWSSVDASLLGTLNLFSLLAFLFVFGLLGYLLHNATHLLAFFAVLLPLLCGLAAAIAVGSLVSRLFAREVGVLTVEDSQLEGRLGKVSVAIRAGGVGEVIFTRPGAGRQSIGARSLDGASIPPDADVVIINVRNGIANVQTWDAFMQGVREGRPPTLETIEPGP
jgi:hypothetical protein